MTGRVDRLQFLTPDTAVLTTYSEIGAGVGRSHHQRRTIDSLIAQRVADQWSIVLIPRLRRMFHP
jgi:hypothetical protein